MTQPEVIDLNAARAARREAKGIGFQIRLGDAAITLPAELPIEVFGPLRPVLQTVMLLAGANDTQQQVRNFMLGRPEELNAAIDGIREALAVLFGPEQWELFTAERPSVQDLIELGRGLIAGYGVSLGELSAPQNSSSPGGATSKAISKPTSASTRGRSGAKTRRRA